MRHLKSLISISAAVAAAYMMTGCSVLSIGEEHFACDGMPDSVFCHSARDVYLKTNEGVVPSPMKKDGAYNEECDDCQRAEDVNPDLWDGPNRVSATDSGLDGVGTSYKSRVGGLSNVTTEYTDEAAAEYAQAVKASKDVFISPEGVVVRRSKDEVIDNYVVPNLPARPIPVRTPAQIMRIWVAPYVDTAGDLQAPGYVYTEIVPRRWIYPDDVAHNPRSYTPLSDIAPAQSLSAPKTNVQEYNSLERYKQQQMRR